MTFERQKELYNQFMEEQKGVMFKKGNDYANTDRLSNFKLTAAIALSTPEQSALQMISTKVVRLGNLLQPGKVASNESVQDSVGDLANYAFLLYCILKEKEEELEEKNKTGALASLVGTASPVNIQPAVSYINLGSDKI